MTAVRYTAGDWYAIVSGGAIALLSPDTLPEIVEQVWLSVLEDEDIDSQLELLTSGQATSLPPFALVSVVDDRMSSFLRGNVRLTVSGGELESVPGTATEITVDGDSYAPPAVFTGGTSHPWVSVVVHDADEFWLAAPIVPGAASSHVALPVRSGVVRAAEVGLVLAQGAPQEVARSAAEPGHGGLGEGFDEELDGQTIIDPEYLARVRAQARLLDDTLPPAAQVPAPQPVAERVLEQVSPSTSPPAPAPAPARTPPTPAPPPALVPAPASAPATAPVPPPPPAARPMQASARIESEEDHDGLTIMSSDLVAIRAQLPNWKQNAVPGPFSVPNPTPPVKLMMSSGLVVTLDRTVLIGRAPVVSRVSNRDLPRVITVESPNHDISRTHAQVRVEGHRVFVTDLHSTNGVLLLVPGAEPQRLRPGVPTDVTPNATVDIGDGVTFQVVRNR